MLAKLDQTQKNTHLVSVSREEVYICPPTSMWTGAVNLLAVATTGIPCPGTGPPVPASLLIECTANPLIPSVNFPLPSSQMENLSPTCCLGFPPSPDSYWARSGPWRAWGWGPGSGMRGPGRPPRDRPAALCGATRALERLAHTRRHRASGT